MGRYRYAYLIALLLCVGCFHDSVPTDPLAGCYVTQDTVYANGYHVTVLYCPD